jgi:hypothetical protein
VQRAAIGSHGGLATAERDAVASPRDARTQAIHGIGVARALNIVAAMKKTKQLRLVTETVRGLVPRELSQINGGVSGGTSLTIAPRVDPPTGGTKPQ